MKILNVKQSVKTIILSVIVVFGSVNLTAQVTIGSVTNVPMKGALLELKTKDAPKTITGVTDPNNATVDANGGGLGLPRVNLTDRATLQPFISTTDPDWVNASQTKIKEHHAGLMVYNLTDNATKNLHQGIYIWDGAKWAIMGGKRFFYLPSFNIEVDKAITGTRTYDLYAEYEKQFKKGTTGSQFISSNVALTEISSLENGHLYEPNELDYVITYYDNSVMTINSVTNGIMAYTINDFNFTEKTFINVVLVVK
ncbi:MAG: hypothetical protein LBU22_05045 [Dysgonamonadaceae bacterium]|jgi:hypothetical protein|nr:hypothetical protein [Dysgonamonadaceae bacterium]